MTTFLSTLGIVFAVFFISFLLINLRGWVKNEEFRGTCASNNPILKEQLGECTLCGKKSNEVCKLPEVEHS